MKLAESIGFSNLARSLAAAADGPDAPWVSPARLEEAYQQARGWRARMFAGRRAPEPTPERRITERSLEEAALASLAMRAKRLADEAAAQRVRETAREIRHLDRESRRKAREARAAKPRHDDPARQEKAQARKVERVRLAEQKREKACERARLKAEKRAVAEQKQQAKANARIEKSRESRHGRLRKAKALQSQLALARAEKWKQRRAAREVAEFERRGRFYQAVLDHPLNDSLRQAVTVRASEIFAESESVPDDVLSWRISDLLARMNASLRTKNAMAQNAAAQSELRTFTADPAQFLSDAASNTLGKPTKTIVELHLMLSTFVAGWERHLKEPAPGPAHLAEMSSRPPKNRSRRSVAKRTWV